MQAHPKNPLLCDDRLQLSAHSTATLTHFPSLSPLTVYITLSPHSQPPQIPPTPLLPLLLFPCSGEWVTSLTPSVSGPSCLFESLSTSIKRLIEKAVFALTRLWICLYVCSPLGHFYQLWLRWQLYCRSPLRGFSPLSHSEVPCLHVLSLWMCQKLLVAATSRSFKNQEDVLHQKSMGFGSHCHCSGFYVKAHVAPWGACHGPDGWSAIHFNFMFSSSTACAILIWQQLCCLGCSWKSSEQQ